MLPIPFLQYSTTTSPQSYTSSTWILSWGPTPSVWYDASMNDFTTNKVSPSTAKLTKASAGGGTPSTLLYTTTLNSLPVLSVSGTTPMECVDTTGSYYTTHFVVSNLGGGTFPSVGVIAYNYSSLGNTQSNRGQFLVQDSPSSPTLLVNSSWAADTISSTYQTSKTYTVASSTWYVSVLTSTHSGSGMFVPSQLFNDSKYNGSSGTPYYTYVTTVYRPSGGGGLTLNKSYHYITLSSNNKYAEIITYYSRISAAEISQVETYLKAKWGISY